MPRGWPPLELREVEAILTVLGLQRAGSRGGHFFWKGKRHGQACSVTVDPKAAPFRADLLQFMCKQARSNRKEFYGAVASAAAKIGV